MHAFDPSVGVCRRCGQTQGEVAMIRSGCQPSGGQELKKAVLKAQEMVVLPDRQTDEQILDGLIRRRTLGWVLEQIEPRLESLRELSKKPIADEPAIR